MRKLAWVAIIAVGSVALLGLVAFACVMAVVALSEAEPQYSPDNPRPTITPNHFDVLYEVTGSAGSVDIVLENETGGRDQIGGAALPFSETVEIGRNEFVYLSARTDGDGGTVTCKISVNGRVIESVSSSGAFVSAICSGRTNR